MYSIEFAKHAEKQLYKLERNVQERIIAALERIRIKPYSHIKKLVGVSYFCLRTGDYRIILDIKDDKFIVYVIEIGHRRNIYK